MYSSFLFCLNMDKFKYIQIVLFGFLILKESSTHPLQNEKKCSPASQAQYEQFPYIVFLRMHSNGETLCQGTLIDVNWILTSAHCINTTDNIPLDDIDIAMRNDGTHETILKPIKVIETKYNDVVLIEMENAINVTSMVAPIELAAEDQLSNNTECIVTSFQKQSNNDLSLMYWNVVNISKQSNGKSEWYLEDTICHSQIWNSLQNITDNGTPLVCNNHLYGIYSLNEPKVFNNIFKYKNWIQNVINPVTSNKTSEKYAKSFKVNNNLSSDTNSITADGVENYTNDMPLSSTEATPSNMDDAESTSPSDLSSKDDDNTEEFWADTKESDDPASSTYSTQSYSSTTIIEPSTTEKSTSSPHPPTTVTGYTEKTTETDETPGEPSVSQSSTTDKFTTTSNPSTTTTAETEETEETEYTEKTSEYTEESTGFTEETTEYTEESTGYTEETTEYTEETKSTEETSDKPSSEPSVSQSSTTEKFTTTSNPSTTITAETEETEESTGYTEETTEYTEETSEYTEESTGYTGETTEYTEETSEYTEESTGYTGETTGFTEETEHTKYTTVTESSTTGVTTLSPKPTTAATEETVVTEETEDGPYSDFPSTRRPVTQSPTTGVTTLSPEPSTDITEKTTESTGTEPSPFSERPSTMYTDRTTQTTETDGTPVTDYDIPTTATAPPTTPESRSSPGPSTTVSDHGDRSNTTTTAVSTTTGMSTRVTYDISDPKETTTFVDEQYKDKSSSRTISVHASLIAIVFCIVYHIHL